MKTTSRAIFCLSTLLVICFLSIKSFGAETPVYVVKNGVPPVNPTGPARAPVYIHLSVTLIDYTGLLIRFDDIIGITIISVLDENGNVVYDNTVDSNLYMEHFISVDTWYSGNYKLLISIDGTELTGTFSI